MSSLQGNITLDSPRYSAYEDEIQSSPFQEILRSKEVTQKIVLKKNTEIDWKDLAVTGLAFSTFVLTPGPQIAANLLRNVLLMENVYPKESLLLALTYGSTLSVAEMGSALSKGSSFSLVSLGCAAIRSLRFAQFSPLEASKISEAYQSLSEHPLISLINLTSRTFNLFVQSYKTLFT